MLDVIMSEPAESVVVNTITVGEPDGAEENGYTVEHTAVLIETVTVEAAFPATGLNRYKAESNAPQ